MYSERDSVGNDNTAAKARDTQTFTDLQYAMIRPSKLAVA